MYIKNPKMLQKSDEAAIEVNFEPPLWRQRRDWANSTISSKTVLDVGCGEASLLEILANDTKFSRLAGLDIDSTCLYQAVHNVKPNQRDFDILREKPLEMELFHGSSVNYDQRLSCYQTIVMLEVVEHLEKNVLEKLPDMIFGRYKPSQVLISTPNSEFNVYFKDLKGFRHWDHKFEWTRAEFQDWCNSIANFYGYKVVFGGVGVFGNYNENIGYCSQTALFELVSPSDDSLMNHDDIPDSNIVLIKHIEYPYFTRQFTRDEMMNEILDNLEYIPLDRGQDFYGVHPISTLWDMLRIRQVCKDYQVLME
jgi:SAM-dependent methyltransferase